MGGMLETRNTIEAVFLLLLVGYPELMWMHLPVTAKVVVMTMTLLPLGVFALMGIGGDSLLQFATHIVLFWMRRRQLHYRRIGYRYGTTNTHKNTRRRKAPPGRGNQGEHLEFVQDYIPLKKFETVSLKPQMDAI